MPRCWETSARSLAMAAARVDGSSERRPSAVGSPWRSNCVAMPTRSRMVPVTKARAWPSAAEMVSLSRSMFLADSSKGAGLPWAMAAKGAAAERSGTRGSSTSGSCAGCMVAICLSAVSSIYIAAPRCWPSEASVSSASRDIWKPEWATCPISLRSTLMRAPTLSSAACTASLKAVNAESSGKTGWGGFSPWDWTCRSRARWRA